MRKEISLLVILLVFGAAFSLSYNLVDIKNQGYPGETLIYNFSVTNDGNTTQAVSIFLPSVAKYTINPNNFEIAPGETKTVQILYTIPLEAQPGTYFISIRVNGQNTNMHLKITVLRPESEYQKINIKAIRGTEFDPRNGGVITLVVDNPVAIVDAKFDLITPFGNQTKTVILQKGENTLSFKINPPINTKPQEYPIKILMYVHGIQKEYDSKIKILGYSSCSIDKRVISNPLINRVEYIVTNNGTEEGNCTIKAYVSGVDKLLLGKISSGYKMEGNEILWNVVVQPNQKVVVYYEVTYYSIYIAVAVAIAVTIFYWWITQTVKVKKSLIDYKKGRGFMDLKMQISVKNMKNKTLKNITVLEHIPALVREVKEFGTMKGEIVKIKGKRYIKWTIDELKPKEEIFLSYKVRTSLEVIGDLVFDPTEVKFKDNGKEKNVKSNVLIVSTE